MVLLDNAVKNQIIKHIDNIINIPDNNWNMFDLKIKIKYIHHMCNLFINEKNLDNKKNQLTIPLKSIPPSATPPPPDPPARSRAAKETVRGPPRSRRSCRRPSS